MGYSPDGKDVTVLRERLVKSQQAGKDLTDAAVNYEVWRSAIAL
jgi:hypothetical protein